MNRRGIFFLLVAIIVVSIFIVSVVVISDEPERRSVEDRVETLDNFMSALEEDIPRRIFITGFRTIFLIENEIVRSGEYSEDVQFVLEEAFFNGTFKGNEEEILNGARFSDMNAFISEKAGKISSEVSFGSPIINISQEDPWHVKVEFSGAIFLRDNDGLAFWNRTLVSSALVPLESFDDPLYVIPSNARVSNKIVRTPFTVFVSGSDVSNLNEHAINSYYISSTSAPSFLDRLQGINAPNENGIESFVNLQEFVNEGLAVQQKTVVDYIYFSANNPSSCNVIPTGMPSWFRLDSLHLGTYGVSCA